MKRKRTCQVVPLSPALQRKQRGRPHHYPNLLPNGAKAGIIALREKAPRKLDSSEKPYPGFLLYTRKAGLQAILPQRPPFLQEARGGFLLDGLAGKPNTAWCRSWGYHHLP